MLPRLLLLFLLLYLAPSANAEGGPGNIDLWPKVSVLADPSHEWTLAQAMQRQAEFRRPEVPRGNLGSRADTVWLRVKLDKQVHGVWWFLIDYPAIDRAALYLVNDGQLRHSTTLGDSLPMNERPVRTRPLAVPLDLPAQGQTELWLKVYTTGPMLLPMYLMQSASFLASETTTSLIQGLSMGFGLCILLYALGAFAYSREWLYMWYSIAIGASTLFFFAYTGLGAIYLWPDSVWLTQNSLLILALVILGAGTFFVERSLSFRTISPYLSKAMITIGALSLLVAATFALDLLSYRQTIAATTILGPLPMLLTVPVAFRLSAQGDSVARWTFAGFAMYLIGIIAASGVSIGYLPVEDWTMHAHQFTSSIQALTWLMVLNLRMAAIKRAAVQALRDHANLVTMSQTDVLTGLLNRRGLHAALAQHLSHATGERLLGLYLIDLDGFKLVNDRCGHDAGDELLRQVGGRLSDAVRNDDVVARIGGDEFVVLATNLRSEAEAQLVGQKLLTCCAAPYVVADATVRVGMTIGYAVAPLDGCDGASLLHRADLAMYDGKHAGKGRARRCTDPSPPL
jgi:diguanylate cyclase (GGDEF)-like protein